MTRIHITFLGYVCMFIGYLAYFSGEHQTSLFIMGMGVGFFIKAMLTKDIDESE